MDVITVAKYMNHRIKALEKAREELDNLSKTRAEAISAYDKEFAKTLIQLKNGVEFDLEGCAVKNPAVSVSEKIAKGLCWRERLVMETSDTGYKSLRSRIDCLKAELNGLQSINRVLDEAPE